MSSPIVFGRPGTLTFEVSMGMADIERVPLTGKFAAPSKDQGVQIFEFTDGVW